MASPSTAKELAPAPGRAEAALGPAASLGIHASISYRHALDGVIPVAKFAETFSCELQEVTLSSPKGKGATLFAAPAEKGLVPCWGLREQDTPPVTRRAVRGGPR